MTTTGSVLGPPAAQDGTSEPPALRRLPDRVPPVRELLRAPLDRRAWLATVHLVLGGALPVVLAPVLAALLLGSTLLLVVALLGLLGWWLALRGASTFARYERWRTALVLGVVVPAPALPEGRGLRRVVADLRSGTRWRAFGLLALSVLFAPSAAGAVTWTWGTGLALAALPLYGWALPEQSPFDGWLGVPAGTLLGVALLLTAPWLARLGAWVHVRLLHLLASDRRPLEDRVRVLEQTRSGVLDAADAERRCIERDLHDGAQPRLVGVAMTLGRARQRLRDGDVPGAQELLDDAHEQAKAALQDLRDLARGIAPSVLADRGLDAALPPLLARLPVPVDLHVHVDPRPPRATEAAGYFVVSEAVTNAAKHAGASRVEVRVTADAVALTVVVRDDGTGTAVLREGGGLLGLQRRVEAADGRFSVHSVPGTGTTVTAVLPCA